MAPIPISAKISLEGVEKAALLQRAVSDAFSKGIDEGLGKLNALRNSKGQFASLGITIANGISQGFEKGVSDVSDILSGLQRKISSLSGGEKLAAGFNNLAGVIKELSPETAQLTQSLAKLKKLSDNFVTSSFLGDTSGIEKARKSLQEFLDLAGGFDTTLGKTLVNSIDTSVQDYVNQLEKATKAETALKQEIEKRQRAAENARLKISGNPNFGPPTPKVNIKAGQQFYRDQREALFNESSIANSRERIAQARNAFDSFLGRAQPNVTQRRLEAEAEAIKKGTKAIESQTYASKGLANAKITLDKFSDAIILAGKRYSAFLVGGGVIFGLISALKSSTSEALEFEKVITKIQQVIGATNSEAGKISDSIRKAAVSTGVKGTDVGEGVLTLAQAGFQDQNQLANLSETLTKIPLAASFDGITQSVEGLLAIFGQFNGELKDTGDIFDVVNQFANDFAIESKDIFEIVKRGGAAFAATGGDLKEFIALSSILRESTRESADTLGTFFKSGVAALLQPRSKGVLAQIGVGTNQSTVGILKDLGRVLTGPDSRFTGQEQVDISRQLVGTRQFARLLALLRELNDPKQDQRIQKALDNSIGSLDRAVGDRLNDVGQNLDKIKESFNDLARAIGQNEGFKTLIGDLTGLVKTGLELTKVLSGLTPLLVSAGLALGAKALGGVGSRFVGKLDLFPKSYERFSPRKFIDVPSSGISTLAALEGDLNAADSARAINRDRLLARAGRARRGRFLRNFGVSTALGGAFGIGAGLSEFDGAAGDAGRVIQSGAALGAGGALFGGAGAAIGFLIGAFNTLTSITKERVRSEQELLTTNRSSFDALEGATQASAKSGSFKGGVLSALNTSLGDALKLLSPNVPSETQIKVARNAREFGGSLSREQQNLLFITDNDRNNPTTFGRKIRSSAESSGQQLAAQLRSLGFDDASVRKLTKAIITGVIKKALPELDKSSIEAVISTFDLGTEAINKFKKNIEDRGAIFANTIRQTSAVLNNALSDSVKSLAAVGDQIRNISTNPLEGRPSIASSNDQILLRSNNLGNFANRLDFVDNATKSVTEFLGKFRGRIADELKAFGSSQGEGQDIIKNSQDFFENLVGVPQGKSKGLSSSVVEALQKDANDLQKRFGDIFDELFSSFNASGGQDFREVVKKLFDSSNIKDEIAGILPDISVIKAIAEQIRKMNEQINQLNDLSRSLTDGIITSKNAFNSAADNLRNIRFTRENASIANARFLRNISGNNVQTLSQDAALASSRGGIIAQRSLIDTNRIDNAIFLAARAAKNQAQLNETQLPATDRSVISFSLQDDLNNSKIVFDDLNRSVAQVADALSYLDQAAEASRNAFKAFDGELAGNTGIKSFSLKDFSKALTDLDSIGSKINLSKVGTTAGIGQATGVLNGLSSTQNERLQRLLSTTGNLSLGKGVSGADVLGDFNRALNVPLLARVRSGLSGGKESVADAQASILRELDNLKQKAADDAAKADALRARQAELVEKQLQVAGLQQDLAKGEQERLEKTRDALTKAIADGLKDFGSVNDTLNASIADLSLGIKDLTKAIGDGVNTTLTISPLNVNIELKTNQFGQLTTEVKKSVYDALIVKLNEVFDQDPEKQSKLNSGSAPFVPRDFN